MKTAIEIAFMLGAVILLTGLWLLAPWLSLTVMGLLTMAGAAVAYTKEPSDTT